MFVRIENKLINFDKIVEVYYSSCEVKEDGKDIILHEVWILHQKQDLSGYKMSFESKEEALTWLDNLQEALHANTVE